MKNITFWLAVTATAFIFIAGIGLVGLVQAQPYSKPIGRYGAVQVAAAAATQIPFNLSGRKGVLIQNLGPNAIFCGYDNAVTTALGIQVAANGGILTMSAGWDGTDIAAWCRGTVLQVSPADTRWTEIK